MANQEHLEILKQGVEVWNQWRQEHADVQPDLSHVESPDTTLLYVRGTRQDLQQEVEKIAWT